MSWGHQSNIKNTKDIITELLILDELCVENNIYSEFIIIGGASLVIILEKEGIDYRTTSDIDIARIHTNDEKTFDKIINQDLKERINTRVEAIMIPDIQEILEINEFEELYHDLFENIKPYIATPELLVVLKSISTRSIDMDDILNSDILDMVDARKTINFIEEYKTYSPFSEVPDAHWSKVVNQLKKNI